MAAIENATPATLLALLVLAVMAVGLIALPFVLRARGNSLARTIAITSVAYLVAGGWLLWASRIGSCGDGECCTWHVWADMATDTPVSCEPWDGW